MSTDEITKVINTWCDELQDLGKKYDWVQIFENKGAMMVNITQNFHNCFWVSLRIYF